MKQQTAVEWLVKQLWGNHDIALLHKQFIEQARQMEKEQIVNAVDGFPLTARGMSGEEYYSETYETPNT